MTTSGPLSGTIRYMHIANQFGGPIAVPPAAENDNPPVLSNLLPEAMVKFVCNSDYNFEHEQFLCEVHDLLPTGAGFRDYFIGIYSGQIPTTSNILFTPHNIAVAPLDPETGAFKPGDFKMGMISQILNTPGLEIDPGHRALLEAVAKHTQRARARGPQQQW
ncbi:MAG: hypothetical protein MRY79_07820 [Alphaproteobacteria bacterium]|nr:hypothetical protein [Alphaproteobacteria bacterium]